MKISLSRINKDFLHSFINIGWMLSWPLDFVALILSIALTNVLPEISSGQSGAMNGRS